MRMSDWSTDVCSSDLVSYINRAPGDARLINAAVPFSTDPNPAAKPFRLPIADTDADRARALDCLAAAVLYEAGDDAEGEQAVAQVVQIGRASCRERVCQYV